MLATIEVPARPGEDATSALVRVLAEARHRPHAPPVAPAGCGDATLARYRLVWREYALGQQAAAEVARERAAGVQFGARCAALGFLAGLACAAVAACAALAG